MNKQGKQKLIDPDNIMILEGRGVVNSKGGKYVVTEKRFDFRW